QFRATATHPTPSGAAIEECHVEVGNYQGVFRTRCLGQDSPIAVEDHGIAGAYLVVVLAYAVGEKQEQPVVVGSGRQPAQEPLAPPGAVYFRFKTLWVRVSLVPDL